MSDPTMQFGGTAVADAPPGVLPPEFDEPSGGSGDRKKLMLVGGLAAVLVVLVAGFFLMHGGAKPAASGPSAPLTPHQAAGTPTQAATKPVKLPKPFNAPVGRDPFKALYTAPVAAADKPQPAPSASAPAVPAPVTTPTTVTTGTGSTGTGSGSTPTPAPTPSPFVPQWVELTSVNGTTSATFVVGLNNGTTTKIVTYANVLAPKYDSKTHNMAPPTQFGHYFSLLSIQDGFVVVKYVDAAPFNLYRGGNNRVFVGT